MPIIPPLFEQTHRGEAGWDIYSRLLKDRIIFLGTSINDEVANLTIAQLLYLLSEDPEKGNHDVYQFARRRGYGRPWPIYDTSSTFLSGEYITALARPHPWRPFCWQPEPPGNALRCRIPAS